MGAPSAFLDNVYSAESGEEMRRYYDDWADSYDADVQGNEYRTPARCAAALKGALPDQRLPILDFACGTGMSGVALHQAGYETIDGCDVSEGMLANAREKCVYRDLYLAEPNSVLDTGGRTYGAIVAVGAIGAGAAPSENIDAAIASLGPGGVFVVSFNEHTLEDPEFEERLTRAISTGLIEKVSAEDGPHLPEMDLDARVWVVRRP